MTTMESRAPRFRLRFQLQEFELYAGDTIIGRSDECHITISDPLISRRHARIRVQGHEAVLEDLGSRNGCRVNGVLLGGPHTLRVGEQIRMGRHEFVFLEIAEGAKVRQRSTDALVVCASCDMPYSIDLGACPSCGGTEVFELPGASDFVDEHGKRKWAIDLMLELFQKAIASNRIEDAVRVMRQAMAALENHLGASPVDAPRLEPVANAAIQLTELQNDAYWARWAVDFHERAGVEVSTALAEAAGRWTDEERTTEIE
jgi:pSer/pThr/pTyr-binding forkhead associated (FHA) protein